MATSELDELRREVAELRRLVDELREPKPTPKTTTLTLDSVSAREITIQGEDGTPRVRFGVSSARGEAGEGILELLGGDKRVLAAIGPLAHGGFGLSVFDPERPSRRTEFGVTTPADETASGTPMAGLIVRGDDAQVAHIGIDSAGCPRFAIERHRFRHRPREGKFGQPIQPPPPPDRTPMVLQGPSAYATKPDSVDVERWSDLQLIRKKGEYRFTIANKQSNTVFTISMNKAGQFSLEVGKPSGKRVSGLRLSAEEEKAIMSWGERGAGAGERVEYSIEYDKKKDSLYPMMRVIRGEKVVKEIYPPGAPKPKPRKKA